MAEVPIADVQGLILRGYGMDALRLFVLRAERAEQARRVLGMLPITAGTPWERKPESCVNVAITFAGLCALGISAQSLASFPEEYRQGAAARASLVGDTGDSAPEKWTGLLAAPDAHVLVFLFAQNAAHRQTRSATLRRLWSGALHELSVHDADMLPGKVAHFGYRDGFSQPTIAGGLPNPVPERLPPAPAGEFLLGYPSQFTDFTYPVPQPLALGLNGSFIAVRILAQDCAAFEKLLAQAPKTFGIDGELLAAKMVGRWRNGVPLALSPDTDTPNPPLGRKHFNDFDYTDDPDGYRCPVGAHIRRTCPRSSPIAGAGGTQHRIVRRGLPYGPPFDPAHPDDGIERGLLGLFIAVSLKDQFEFLLSEWVHGNAFAPGLHRSKDPILGDNSGAAGTLTIPRPGAAPIVVSGFSRLVQTRGAAYGFLPSLSALAYIASAV
jgi:deferrochelatase/peroxidase EfeB